jgi:GNAT superfamily N-acetyltransferase
LPLIHIWDSILDEFVRQSTKAMTTNLTSPSKCANLNQVDVLTRFFRDNVTKEYISHGEIQIGRAINNQEWSPDLLDVLAEEFNGLVEGFVDIKSWPRIAVGVINDNNDNLACLAIVNVHRDSATHSYAVFEDIVVHRDVRGQGVGAALIHWLEEAVTEEGCSEIFLESGLGNEKAHNFFHHQGFQTCSVTMVKPLFIHPSLKQDNRCS